MAVRLTADGEVDKRTKEYKDSQKKKFRWWKIPFYPFYWIYRLIKFVFYFYYYIFVFSYKILCYIYKKGRILYGEIRTYYLNKKKRK